MRLIKENEGEHYEPAHHHDAYCVRKISKADGCGKLSVSVSEFLPGGGCDLTASDKDRSYYILQGTLEVYGEGTDPFIMEAGDMLFVPAGEKRGYKITGSERCRMIVMIQEV